ncbi:TPA: tail fiber protein [Yersinia enterocolitica]|nr:tail fiber protein [Yersinia enterocolitica]
MTQAEYEALAARSGGFSSGVAKSEQLNKVWRQSSFMASVLADFIAARSGNDVLDNGNTATLLASLELAIKEYANSNLPVASTLQQGITKLSSLTNSSSETLAATLKAVKTVSDEGLKITGNLAEIKAAGPAAIAEAQSNLDLAALLGDALQKANNLSEIKTAGPAAVAQTLLNLGLGELPDSFGDAASKNVGTTAGTVAAGDDSRIVNAVQPSNPALCTAWVNFNGVAPATIKSSHNVSSITRLSTGKYKINFTEPMNNINYCPVASMADGTAAGGASIVIMQDGTNIATSSPLKTINDFTVYIRSTGGAFDSTDVNAIVYGGK